MAKKNAFSFQSNPLLIPLIFFLVGGFFSYLLIITTNIFPINYEKKFEQQYDNQKREQGWETYIDFVKGYTFNYPNYYYVNTGVYITSTRRIYKPGGYGGLLDIGPGKSAVKMYDKTINLLIAKLDKDQNLLDFVKNTTFSDIYVEMTGSKYQQATINGNQVVIADFEMTENLYKKEAEIRLSVNRKSDIVPIGYKRKTIYIKRGDFTYRFQSGSLYDDSQVEIFSKIIQSFKFIY